MEYTEKQLKRWLNSKATWYENGKLVCTANVWEYVLTCGLSRGVIRKVAPGEFAYGASGWTVRPESASLRKALNKAAREWEKDCTAPENWLDLLEACKAADPKFFPARPGEFGIEWQGAFPVYVVEKMARKREFVRVDMDWDGTMHARRKRGDGVEWRLKRAV